MEPSREPFVNPAPSWTDGLTIRRADAAHASGGTSRQFMKRRLRDSAHGLLAVRARAARDCEHAVVALLAFLPSPASNGFHVGPLFFRAYGICYVFAVLAAVVITGRRWGKLGGDPALAQE